ncbi:MAG: DUF4136 domain-containing protein [Acidobacteriota bacterium]
MLRSAIFRRLAGGFGGLLLLAQVSLLLGCATSQPVRSWVERSASFEECNGFAWLPRGSRPWNPQLSPRLDAVVREEIARAMAARGCPERDSASATFSIYYQFTPPDRFGPSAPGPIGSGSSTSVGIEVERSSGDRLYVEAREAATGKTVWRGWAGNVMARGDDTVARFRAATARILATFPVPVQAPALTD